MKTILNPKLGDIKATKLTTEQVKSYRRDRLGKVKPDTVNRELGMLHCAYQLGYEHDPPLVARVPTFPKLPGSAPRKGFRNRNCIASFWLNCPDDLRLLFVVAYHVGLRKGALLRIKWGQVNLEAWLYLDAGQEGEPQAEAGRRPDLRRYGKVRRDSAAPKRVSLRAWIEADQGFLESWLHRLHEGGAYLACCSMITRRTAVRNLRRAGVVESVIMKITDHRTRGVFERYNITDQTDTQEAGRMAEAFLERKEKTRNKIGHKDQKG